MTSLTVLAVGNIKEGYLRDGIAEYKKRLSAYASVDIKEIPEVRVGDEGNAAVRSALQAEGQKILSAVPKGAYLVALCVEGKEMDSLELAALLRGAIDRCGKICFVIGSSHGLSAEVKKAADIRLSFSRLTFPHQLMRLIMMESLYRSMTILAGKTYHK